MCWDSLRIMMHFRSDGSAGDAFPRFGQHFQRNHHELAQGRRSQRASGKVKTGSGPFQNRI